MTFEAGPWHCFGNELLDRLLQLVQHHPVPERSSQGALNAIPSKQENGCSSAYRTISGGGSAMSQLFENEKKITFMPDYSATIRDDCTYLEISAHTYLLAYKSTLISRNR